MKEQLITFDTAKLAKEKGFKLQSNPFGYITKFYNHNTGTLLSYGRTGKTDLSKAYYAPTQSLLQKWLREIGDIYVSINTLTEFRTYSDDPGDDEYIPVHKFRIIKNIDNFKYDVIEWSDSYKTYEDALEKGLQEALKLIK